MDNRRRLVLTFYSFLFGKRRKDVLRNCLTLLALTIFTVSFSKAQPSKPGKTAQGKTNVKWLFETRMDRDDETPLSKAYLLIGKRKILVRGEAMGRYDIVERKDYKALRAPSSTIAACSIWWAGQGQDLYVIRRNKQLIVFIRFKDEEAPTTSYEPIKTIRLP
jgi:hypothetical protein